MKIKFNKKNSFLLSKYLCFVIIINIYLIYISYYKTKKKKLNVIFSHKYSIYKNSQQNKNKKDIYIIISNIEYLINYKLKLLEIKYIV